MDPSTDDWLKTESETWVEFNDSNVKFYTFYDIEKDAFGDDNSMGRQNSGGWGANYYEGQQMNQSAYILVYEKRQKKPIRLIVDK